MGIVNAEACPVLISQQAQLWQGGNLVMVRVVLVMVILVMVMMVVMTVM